MKNHCRLLLTWAVVTFFGLGATIVKATPYASEITNNNGTIQFYINESGGNVTVTYEDGSTNENFNGVTTGTNVAAGPYSFSLTDNSIVHTSYTISIFKIGSGKAGLVPTPFQTPHTFFFSKGSFRGVDVNKNPESPDFGQIYIAADTAPGLYRLNADGSLINSNSAGISWLDNGLSPYRIGVAPDDYLMVGDYSSSKAGVYRVSPDLTTGQLFLGPPGDQVTNQQGQIVHGLIFSRPLVIGALTNNGVATLMDIDNDFPGSDANAILIYTNITTNSLPWETPPAYIGPEVGLNFAGLGNVYPGLSQGGPNNYIYASNYRNNYAVPTVDVFDSTGTNLLWNSLESAGGPDVFVTSDPLSNAGLQGPVDSAISPDGQYFVALAVDNHMTLCSCTNGIPNAASAQIIDTLYDQSYYENARGICWDAADNIYLVSSGTGLGQSWTLGLTATTVATGNASGQTGFQVVYPPYSGSVVSSNAVISQPNSYGNPTTGGFVISLNSIPTNSVTVNYTVSGTALGATANGVTYPATITVNPPSSVTFGIGQTTAVVTVTSVSDSIPRPTTAVTLTIGQSGQFLPKFPQSATISVLNTAPQELFTTVGSPTMYNAFSNDYCSFAITRWGDTNLAAYVVNSFNITGGTATEGQDYTAPTPVTINPGDLTDYSYIYPLVNGKIPVHTNVTTYVGNKSITAALASAGAYTAIANTNSFMIVDSANPPATVLYYDPLTNSAPTNWIIRPTDENYPNTSPDYYVDFGYNLASDSRDPDTIPITLPPNGQPTALRVTTGKGGSVGSQTEYSAGVNLYLTNTIFSGDYAVRFEMNVTEPNTFGTSGSFEGPLFGIDCSGNQTNWYLNSSPSAPANTTGFQANFVSDGVWVWMTDNQYYQYNSYTLFALGGATNSPKNILPTVGVNSTSFKSNFKPAVFSSPGAPGLPANGSPDNSLFNPPFTNVWADVELKQYVSGTNGIVTLSIDKTPILTYTGSVSNGTVMLGYETPVFGGDGPDGAAYFSDLKVVQLTPPAISSPSYNPQTSTLTFNISTPDGSVSPSSFEVLSSTVVTGPYTNIVSGATITQLPTSGSAQFQVKVPLTGAVEFYRLGLL